MGGLISGDANRRVSLLPGMQIDGWAYFRGCKSMGGLISGDVNKWVGFLLGEQI